jgi:hypothetical protein
MSVVTVYACLIYMSASSGGCGGWLPRIEYFAKWGPRKCDCAPGASKIGEVAMFVVIVYTCLIFMSASSGECGGWLPRIEYFAKWGPRKCDCAPGAPNIGEVSMFVVNLYACLIFMSASSGGCGGGLPRIEDFAKWGP